MLGIAEVNVEYSLVSPRLLKCLRGSWDMLEVAGLYLKCVEVGKVCFKWLRGG
jgi:hypothetical protein